MAYVVLVDDIHRGHAMYRHRQVFSATLLLFSLFFSHLAFALATPQEIQGYIAHANPSKALELLAPVLKNDPHSAKAWYLKAEALDEQGNSAAARSALMTSEHLSPAMTFANPVDLKRLEQRVGAHDVAQARSNSKLKRVLGVAMTAFMIVIGIALLIRQRRQGIEDAVAEQRRSDLLVEITTFIGGDLKRALISAKTAEDSLKENTIQEWTESLVSYANLLKRSENSETSEKLLAVNDAGDALLGIRRRMKNNDFSTQNVSRTAGTSMVENYGASDRTETSRVENYGTSDHTQTYAYQNAPQAQPQQSGLGGGGFLDSIEQGVGLGVGLSLGEDLMGGILGRSSDDSTNFSGSNDGLSDSSDSFGGIDDGLSGSSDSFGSTDDGLSDSSDDSSDDSW